MDVFRLRQSLVDEYKAYIDSFIRIRDEQISSFVTDSLERGVLWPEPLIQLNPSFERGDSVDELVASGVLHPACSDIFRAGKSTDDIGRELLLYRHQSEAIRTARDGHNYVLTTGTGSGKSLSYIVPIVDHVLRRGSGQGVQAIIVYPMNALANSQVGELEKFLTFGLPGGKSPVTFERYTGQERGETRARILAKPPDILLTNYVMLELILTRPEERSSLVQAAQGLQFFVLDELHTYRGRQGSDVALLVRRVRQALAAPNMQCVGTSATLAGAGTHAEQQVDVARVASQLFGTTIAPEHVIGETLRRATPDVDEQSPSFVEQLTAHVSNAQFVPPTSFAEFASDPLSAWIERTFGVEREPGSGRLRRAVPRRIGGHDGAAADLAAATGVSRGRAINAIREWLLAGYACERDPESGRPLFAFRLHQFINRGDTVFATLEHAPERHLTLEAQLTAPGDGERRLLPLAFCRECGEAYFVVRAFKNESGEHTAYFPRDLGDRSKDDESEPGYLHLSVTDPWPIDHDAALDRLPDTWLEDFKGGRRVKSSQRPNLPRPVRVAATGLVDDDAAISHFVRAPFRFCLHCGVTYAANQSSDFGKLSAVGAGGRSTATTILSISAIRHLRQSTDLPERARKLLSFTDNRQDASLQAGHLNDFVEIGILRGALYAAALAAGPDGLAYDVLAERIFDTLRLPTEEFALKPDIKYQALAETEQALRKVIAYRLYRDLRRGWRVTSPNLEQAGLLAIRYLSLDDVAADHEIWCAKHAALASASAATRAAIAKVLLDWMRRELAIRVDALDPQRQEALVQQSDQRLKAPWALDNDEALEYATTVFPRSSSEDDASKSNRYLSPLGGFGRFLRHSNTFGENAGPISVSDTKEIICGLLEGLERAGLVARVLGDSNSPTESCGFQIPASAIRWCAADGTSALHDPIRVPREADSGSRTNSFFVDFYRNVAMHLIGVEAREHTAQVPNEMRQEREDRFRSGKLPILYCSPTMELGVDIAQLNVVNLRNVPPTPANYAQRSGRAGRSGQPAMVVAYCTTGSPHDQYFFKRPEQMVAGAVAAPRLDLANEDLVRAHIHAVWLAEAGLSLGSSLRDILDVDGESPTLEILPGIATAISDRASHARALSHARDVLRSIENELAASDWYTEDWLERVFADINAEFNGACERWRDLFRGALGQIAAQNRVIVNAASSAADRAQAKRLRREAEAQLELLSSTDSLSVSDFYSYRYFASEGFLPGYSFPRLPLSAFIPARQSRGKDEFVSRPRFLAISEFGPRAIIYHEGSRYMIHKVVLPVGEEDVLTRSAKICASCGYLHPMKGEPGLDLCQACKQPLPTEMDNLLPLRNVATKRKDRISSDEEERLRLGYEIVTGVRYAEVHGEPLCRRATVRSDGRDIAGLEYGHAATLWRINLGWKRRANKQIFGFVLDTDRGYWARDEHVEEDAGKDDPMSPRRKRVVPYVEDRRNSLIFEMGETLDKGVAFSLMAALKNAVQVEYQLEDSEIAAEALPSAGSPRYLLFYEAAEGGAGVLRQLIGDPGAFARIARRALDICHFDPETGEDLRRAPNAAEDCSAACYNCLMSYFNQPAHAILNRHRIRPILLDLANASVAAEPAGPAAASSPIRKAGLDDLSLADIVVSWLKMAEELGLRIPATGQIILDGLSATPDFVDHRTQAAIYVDGAAGERSGRDADAAIALEDAGWTVVRFGNESEWRATFERLPSIFGELSASSRKSAPGSPVEGLSPDLDLFPSSWRPIVAALARADGVTVVPGEDVSGPRGVVGSYVLQLLGPGDVFLWVVDASDEHAGAVVETIRGWNRPVFAVSPGAVDEAVRAILRALAETR